MIYGPIKSSLARTVGRLFGVQKDTDLSLRGDVQSSRFVNTAIEATGGTTNTDGGYNQYHIYTIDTPSPERNFTVTSGTDANIELLVVGGGGAAAFDNGGGGGAGGIAYVSNFTSQCITRNAITIGPGGQGSSTFGYPGHPSGNPTRGTNSTFTHPAGTITGLGGGGPANETPNYEVTTPFLLMYIQVDHREVEDILIQAKVHHHSVEQQVVNQTLA